MMVNERDGYLVARATIRAAREQDMLLPAVVNLESLTVLDEDPSEVCLARMVSDGTDSDAPVPTTDILRQAYGVAESALHQLRADTNSETNNRSEKCHQGTVSLAVQKRSRKLPLDYCR